MKFEEINARFEILRGNMVKAVKEQDSAYEDGVNKAFDKLHKIIEDAQKASLPNEIKILKYLNCELLACECSIDILKSRKFTCSLLLEVLNHKIDGISNFIEKEKKRYKLTNIFMEMLKKEDSEEGKKVLQACLEHSAEIMDLIG